ncbi:4-alpha-glucanotransferase [Aetokthonos hydrillicola Thurmond2011]|jgi:4-alpha-glucanotransferase|uniref:4-alpha-glucanotransferase n=1 Tax=Aetokthonos hydrillicola Thurmond2011 TaxID=2712845 RepID=A0AAP5I4D4_9CYAN|nr:4-alpha-glucanotransferase [Aetokthonos hydrillicola]MBO3459392.1 4-alpha-glucanotransferase [Aetokthonos hydrillicola CCALA 1050]MBW4586538.1 4-alpha-glucanotransferase [Aetokthonos hydrillicola CCALA 1050]MDR9893517.1 4-alpha-glucanotransferase [Aetokthonos hydrillicola Thurmond2011]
MLFSRASGILLHPTSFPNQFGIGDFGFQAYGFIDFLTESKQKLWQVLPLGPTGNSNSPYASYSAMAGNPLLISPELLYKKGFLAQADFTNLPQFLNETVDFSRVIATKMPMLQKACDNFKANATSFQQQEFSEFCDSQAYWLDDYALFMALKDAHNGANWNAWEPEIAQRKPEAIKQWQSLLVDEIFYYQYLQFEFFCQWSDLKRYANQRGIQIIGDIAIYVAHDSSDVWAHPENFCLDKQTGEPALMAGTPPDYFSTTGQLWGNPVYDWKQLEQDNFKWWVQRFQTMLNYVDLIRIDHFRGFQAYWAVKQGETTAINGEWIEAPGVAFFELLKEKLGNLPIIAEDLGEITPEVYALRDRFEFPGMKILQFAFGEGLQADKRFLPFNYQSNCVVYTGTHDNDTTVGWFNQLKPQTQEEVLKYLNCTRELEIHWDLIQLALSSVANQAIIPLQDVLGLGTEARMNFPGKNFGNWGWRYQSGDLTQECCDRLRSMTEIYGRA